MKFVTVTASGRQIAIEMARIKPAFAAFAGIGAAALRDGEAVILLPDGSIGLGDAAFAHPALLEFHLRYALELGWLRRAGVAPPRAALAAGRGAGLFALGETIPLAVLPGWAKKLQTDLVPSAASLADIASDLRVCADDRDVAAVRRLWTRLGTAEALMETGGDIRLARDPVSGLNGYGSSHRPRPWAVTFASSTASSCSERGYAAADLARLRVTAAMLNGPERAAVSAASAEIRSALARIYGLDAEDKIVLAASGTDTELLALAVTHLAVPSRPILNILIAPEETGSGVPMAAQGLHFAVDTAFGHDVARAAPIAGFAGDTTLRNIALRDGAGAVRPADDVAAEVFSIVADGIAAGQRVILHVLDLSKTGLLAPGLANLRQLRARHGDKFDIVVDACQARLSPGSVRKYLALDAVVLLTGSKFFTGPPFAGAALLPARIAARFRDTELPAGLDAYFGRDDFWENCPAAVNLPPAGNYGLALRWHAALAEISALFAVAPAERAEVLRGFADVVLAEMAANPALRLLPAPVPERGQEDWECCQSIFTFALRALHVTPARELTPEEARAVYRWLNADLSQIAGLSLAAQKTATRICHIGQPVKLPAANGGLIGVLRVSAGARLISGEPSHQELNPQKRLTREFDDLRMVFAKIKLILERFDAIKKADPQPRYR